jgi:flagellar protein FliO/FliZ
MTSGLPPGVDMLGLASSFLLVIGLLAVLLFALKRMQGLSGGLSTDRQIKHLETMPAGARQKIVLLKVKDREILVGISPGAMVTLAEWTSHDAAAIDDDVSSDGFSGNAESRARVLEERDSLAPTNNKSTSFAQIMAGLATGTRSSPGLQSRSNFQGPLQGWALNLRRLLGRS